MYLHLLRYLNPTVDGERRVAFYHRNTSENRKQEILNDLKLPLACEEKKLLAVVATVSLGVGVDIRVKNSVNFGLAATMEDLLQEGGRVMRGSSSETEGRQGYSFFLHKGTLGNYIQVVYMGVRICSFMNYEVRQALIFIHENRSSRNRNVLIFFVDNSSLDVLIN